MTTVQSLIPSGFSFFPDANTDHLVHMILAMAVGCCILGGLIRFLSGPESAVSKAISACIHIFFLYLIVIAVFALVPAFRSLLPPLPFLSVDGTSFSLWALSGLSSEAFFSALLRLFVLAVLVNLLEEFIPKGSKFLHWYFFRLITACAALGLYIGICALSDRYAPNFFGSWSGTILISFWLLIGILGLSKGMLILVAAVVNPILGVLFAFFFSNVVGKQFTKSIGTCLLAIALIYALQAEGVQGFVFSDFSLSTYGLCLLFVSVLLYLFGRFL